MTCTSHHHACQCREAAFKRLRDAAHDAAYSGNPRYLENLREALREFDATTQDTVGET